MGYSITWEVKGRDYFCSQFPTAALQLGSPVQKEVNKLRQRARPLGLEPTMCGEWLEEVGLFSQERRSLQRDLIATFCQ